MITLEEQISDDTIRYLQSLEENKPIIHFVGTNDATSDEISKTTLLNLSDLLSSIDEEVTLTSIVQKYTEQLKTMKINRSKWEEERRTDSDIQECDRLAKQLASVLSDLNRLIKRIPDSKSIEEVANKYLKQHPDFKDWNDYAEKQCTSAFIAGINYIKQFIEKSNG